MNSKSTPKTHSVTVNNNIALDISEAELQNFDSVSTSNNKRHVLYNDTSYEAEIVESDFPSKTYKVKINNNLYTVAIHSPLDQLIKDMGFEIGANKKITDVKAPMPGLILDINVSVGKEVKENDSLLILEAMKMENVIVSPRDGVIKSISVEKGNAVDKNQLLIEFE